MKHRFYKIEISGYGGEVVLGNISNDQFNFWTKKEKSADGSISQYFSNFEFYPEKTNKPIPPNARFNRSWFEIDDIVHVNGPEMTDDNSLTIIETDKEGNKLEEDDIDFEEQIIKEKFKVKKKIIDENIKSLKNKKYFFAQIFEEGVWDTEESGFGLIKTNENGLNYKDLIFHIAEILGTPICFALSYGKKKYDLIGNTMTKSSQMKVYKN